MKNLLEIAAEFNQKNDAPSSQVDNDDSTYSDEYSIFDSTQDDENEVESNALMREFAESQQQKWQQELAQSLLSRFERQWATPLTAIAAIDELFGTSAVLPSWIRKEQAQIGCGLESGIWQNSGWTKMRELQTLLRNMPELRKLVSSLGKRPTVEGKDKKAMPPQRQGLNHGVARSSFAPTGSCNL